MQLPELERFVREHGLEFSPILPASEADAKGPRAATLPSEDLRLKVERIASDMETFLRNAPSAVVRAKVDALIVDEIVLAGPTVAQLLGLPYFVVSTSMPHSLGWLAPRRFLGYKYPNSNPARLQNELLQLSVFRMRGPIRRRLDEFRRTRGLGPIQQIGAAYPPLAHIAQLPRSLDLPRSHLPANFHYAGPFVDEAQRPTVEFPWDRLDGRPLVYASMGTAKTIQRAAFPLIAEVCAELNLQLVISLGGQSVPGMAGLLPGNPVIVKEAPQMEILKHATLVITHGGLNTVLEALTQGIPMIVMPFAYDQPAVAARLARLKVAEVIQAEGLSAHTVRRALARVLGNPGYRQIARKLQASIRAARGLEHACDVIEGSLRNTRMTIQ